MRVTNFALSIGTQLSKEVSIPYMRVTNEEKKWYLQRVYQSFNPLYAGHKPRWILRQNWHFVSFNPLYAGHKRIVSSQQNHIDNSFNPLYAGHKHTIKNTLVVLVDVSIPYMRVTNINMLDPLPLYKKFQSPICGSQTLPPVYKFPVALSFNPLYAGHKLLIRTYS